MFEQLLIDSTAVLDCPAPGCVRGCSACVLTADLYRQAEIIDRQAALVWARAARAALASVPEEDRAMPGAVLARSVADEIAAAVERGARAVTIWPGQASDLAALGSGCVAALARRVAELGGDVALVVLPEALAALDPAAQLALRDAALALRLRLRRNSPPRYDNGAVAVATVGGEPATVWTSRDPLAGMAGDRWGQGRDAPVVRGSGSPPPLSTPVDLATLLPASGTSYIELHDELDGTIAGFGERLAAVLLPAIRLAGGTGPLQRMTFNDRYLQSPLVVRLMTEALAALRDALLGPQDNVPLRVVTNRLRPNERQPFAPDHDWQWEEDRAAVLTGLLHARGLASELVEHGAEHGRVLTLRFVSGTVQVVLDQGFGPWRTPRFARWDHFGDDPERQVFKIALYSALIAARGPSYAVVVG